MPKVVMKHADMNDELSASTLAVAQAAFDSCKSEREVAAQIRRDMDKQQGRTWNVVVGKGFGSNVTHQTKHYCQIQFGQLTVLIWKSS
jgi:dynein light chain LC8-type